MTDLSQRIRAILGGNEPTRPTVSEPAPVDNLRTDDGWHVKVNDAIYGPYPLDDLLRFIAEGRIKPESQVSTDPERGFRDAAYFVQLSRHFRVKQNQPARMATPSPEGGAQSAAQARPAATGHAAPVQTHIPDREPSNFILFLDLRSDASGQIVRILHHFGLCAEADRKIWVLRTRLGINEIRKALMPYIRKDDQFLLVDAGRNRIGWHNLGPETDTHIRGVWNQSLDE
jgi:hypothetical protein